MKCPRCQQPSPEETLFCGHCGYRLKNAEPDESSFTATMHLPVRELPIGTLFARRYLVVASLGKGGMGKVYKVLDKELNEVIALKVLKPEISSDEQIIERFRNELKLARRISHKNICGMYHLSKDENETHYITMEFVPGEDLKTLIHRIGQLSLGKTVSIAKQICEGLAEAHRLGVVHRDLKPQNIMIDQEGHVRIMDFGIARSLQREGLTEADMVVGTADYMAPEQIEGTEIDHRTDIYSLGVVLFEMLTGQTPFQAATPLSLAFKHKTETPPDPQQFNLQIPDSLSQIILKCLEKKREDRFNSSIDLRQNLDSVEQSLSPSGVRQRERPVQRTVPLLQKRIWKWAAGSLLAVLLLSAGYFFVKQILKQPWFGSSRYENFISFEWSPMGMTDGQEDLIQYLMLRSLESSTRLNIFVHEDILIYKKRTESAERKALPPVLAINGKIDPKVTGFEIALSVKVRNKTFRKRFDCKGTFDFLDDQLGSMLAFIAANSEGLVSRIEGNRSPAQISSPSPDALAHFLTGETAWNKLDPDTAFYEYRTALENDPEFGLAYLKLAEVLNFRSDREGVRQNLQQAQVRKDRLTANDVLRLDALLARINSRPAEERQAIGKLVEEFPFKKEYHYELAESYFHCGDADEAVKHYARALELDPDYAKAHNHIAFCYSWIGDHKKAEEHFRRYIELDHTGNSYDSLASGLMFAGRYDDAVDVLRRGMEISPNLDYLYGNTARNYLLKGALSLAGEAVEKQIALAKLPNTKMSAQFLSAYIEYLRGDRRNCRNKLAPVTEFFSKGDFFLGLDESPSLPFWLLGVMAADDGDLQGLRDQIAVMEKKIVDNNVSATNYFPVYKFYVHLKALEGLLENDVNKVLINVEEGRRMRNKMGYWGSLYDLTFFFSQYARILIRLQQFDQALSLLNEALSYNPNSPCCRLSLAEVYVQKQEKEKAQEEIKRASELLSEADKDSHLVRQLERLGASQ